MLRSLTITHMLQCNLDDLSSSNSKNGQCSRPLHILGALFITSIQLSPIVSRMGKKREIEGKQARNNFTYRFISKYTLQYNVNILC